jgi:hypothetical protein
VSVGEDGSIFYWYLLDNVAGGGAAVEAKELEMR